MRGPFILLLWALNIIHPWATALTRRQNHNEEKEFKKTDFDLDMPLEDKILMRRESKNGNGLVPSHGNGFSVLFEADGRTVQSGGEHVQSHRAGERERARHLENQTDIRQYGPGILVDRQLVGKLTGPEVVPIEDICDSFHLDSIGCLRVRTYIGETLRNLKAPLHIRHPVSTRFQYLRGDTTTATALKDPAMPGAPIYQHGIAKSFGMAIDNASRFVDGPQPCMVAADDEAWLKAWRYPTMVRTAPVHETSGNHVIVRVWNRHNLGGIGHQKQTLSELLEADIPFGEKTDSLIWRGVCTGEIGRCDNGRYANHSRMLLVSKYFNSPESRIDVGFYRDSRITCPMDMYKDKKDMPVLLKSRYMMVVEGNDVASSAILALGSNSVPLMTPPVVQTWDLHGWLEPWKHFIPIEPDFSDLQTKLQWAIANPVRAEQIANEGKKFLMEFQDQERESRINNAVVVAYFNRFRIERSDEGINGKRSTFGYGFPEKGSSRCLIVS